MRKPLRRAEIEALTTLLYDDNTEGPLDGLQWTNYPDLFVRRTRNTASWVFRWNVAGGKSPASTCPCATGSRAVMYFG